MKNTSEKRVVALWRKQLQRQRCLVDSEGAPLEVVYPGRLNDSRGADFRDAVVAAAGGFKNGEIEIHTRNSGWQTHGHHRDPAYNQVILHVALEQDRAGKTVLQNGLTVPTIILKKCHFDKDVLPSEIKSGLPCQHILRRRKSEDLVESLEHAGDQRWAMKVSRFTAELSHLEENQCLYQGILEGLGYSKNKAPFRELAQRLSFRTLNDIAAKENSPDQYRLLLQALLLGQAGFISSRLPQLAKEVDYFDKLERLWYSIPQSNVMSYRQWELLKVRPGNHPVRRILALSWLLQRFRHAGILPSILNLIRQTPADCRPSSLEKALVVRVEGCRELSSIASQVLLGRGRVAEIVVNVILPFTLSWSQISGDLTLSSRVLELYRLYPRLEENSVEKHMLQQLSVPRRWINSAHRQQGLLHIYQTLCAQGKCRECSLGL